MNLFYSILVLILLAYSDCSPQVEVYAADNYIIVAKDGSGDFTTIQSAINSIPESRNDHTIIFIKKGIYHEKLFIEHSKIIICGESRDSTIIQFAELRKNWRQNNNDNDYGSAVVNIKKNVTDLVFRSLTIINNYGSLYGDHDHAFAIRGFDGVTRIILDDCSIISDGGDTVSLWNTDDGMYYHRNCYFEGWVDYVCPRGYCLIEDSKFYGHNLTASIWHDGSKNEDHKFVIKNSYFDGIKGFPLGRFHRDSQFYLIDCNFSSNMAEKQIFFASSDPPRTLQWGEKRIYFSNCNVEGKDYLWLKDNLDQSKEKIEKENINASWVFKDKWNPEQVLELLDQEIKNLRF